MTPPATTYPLPATTPLTSSLSVPTFYTSRLPLSSSEVPVSTPNPPRRLVVGSGRACPSEIALWQSDVSHPVDTFSEDAFTMHALTTEDAALCLLRVFERLAPGGEGFLLPDHVFSCSLDTSASLMLSETRSFMMCVQVTVSHCVIHLTSEYQRP